MITMFIQTYQINFVWFYFCLLVLIEVCIIYVCTFQSVTGTRFFIYKLNIYLQNTI